MKILNYIPIEIFQPHSKKLIFEYHFKLNFSIKFKKINVPMEFRTQYFNVISNEIIQWYLKN